MMNNDGANRFFGDLKDGLATCGAYLLTFQPGLEAFKVEEMTTRESFNFNGHFLSTNNAGFISTHFQFFGSCIGVSGL